MNIPKPILQFLRTLPTKLDQAFIRIIRFGRSDASYFDRLMFATQELQRQNRLREALKLCNRALALSPSNYAVLHSRGELLEILGRTDEATADYSRSLSLRMKFLPDDPETFYYSGFYCSHIGQYEDAIADFNRALTFNPNNVMVIHNRAIAYSALGKLDDALEDYDHVCKLTPNAIPVLDERARLNYNLKRDEDIVRDISHINTLVAPDEEHLYRQGLLMSALFHLNQFEQALEICDLILSFTHDNAAALQVKGHVLYKLGRLDEALNITNSAMYLEPTNTTIRAHKMLILYGLQRIEEAIIETNDVLAQQSDDAEALSIRALLYARSEQLENGKQDLARAKALEPSAIIVRLAEAGFLSLSGETQAALAILSEIIQANIWAKPIIARDPVYTNLHSLPEWHALIDPN